MLTATLTPESRAIQKLLKAWHENGRYNFERSYKSLVYDTHEQKIAKDRRKYIALDNGTSGVFLVEKETGLIYAIKGYGVPNLKKCVGTVEELTAHYESGTATQPK